MQGGRDPTQRSIDASLRRCRKSALDNLEQNVEEHLVSLLPEYNVVVKLHPYSWTGKYVSHRQHELFERLAARQRLNAADEKPAAAPAPDAQRQAALRSPSEDERAPAA